MIEQETSSSKYAQQADRNLFSLGFCFMAGITLIAADQITKLFVFKSAYNMWLLEGNLGIQMFANYNFAFSLPIPSLLMYGFYFAALLAIAVFVICKFTELPGLARLGWTLIIAGALSNVGERIIFGYVKDFIFIFQGIFNIADLYILAGVILLLAKRSALKPV